VLARADIRDARITPRRERRSGGAQVMRAVAGPRRYAAVLRRGNVADVGNAAVAARHEGGAASARAVRAGSVERRPAARGFRGADLGHAWIAPAGERGANVTRPMAARALRHVAARRIVAAYLIDATVASLIERRARHALVV